jgi:3-hydroxyacyl-CoA dehydrogenase
MNAHPIEQVAVIGGGLMGHGIALEFAAAGYTVALHDVSADALRRAQDSIAAALQRLAQLGVMTTEQCVRAKERIHCSTPLPDLVADADLVIESATEDLETKRRIFAELDRLCPAHTIPASNSSSLVPSAYASATQRPARVLGVHYFNPPYLMPCVELVMGPVTAEATLDGVRQLLTALGKRVVVVRQEIPGFIANRLQAALVREAMSLIERGVATPADVDAAVQYGIGRRYAVAGPFEIVDLAGLHTILAAGRHLTPSLECSATVSRLLEDKVAHGELGAKAGKGFYDWTPDSEQAARGRVAEGLARQLQWDAASVTNRGPFTGAWRLVSFEASADGETTFPFGQDAVGLLICTASGQMSVMLSKSRRPGFSSMDPTAGAADERVGAFESCFAYSGTFEATEGRVIHPLQQCTFPNWAGTEQVRFFCFEEGRLILETPPLPTGGRNAVSRLTWERINA